MASLDSSLSPGVHSSCYTTDVGDLNKNAIHIFNNEKRRLACFALWNNDKRSVNCQSNTFLVNNDDIYVGASINSVNIYPQCSLMSLRFDLWHAIVDIFIQHQNV